MSDFFPPRPKRERIRTAICLEQHSKCNPFVAEKTLWHGYDAETLGASRNWTEILFLLAQGELPTARQNLLLNRLMSSLANPGPRDAAVRAAMNCGIGKTPLPTILTTGLTVRGGMAEGAMHVEAAMRFLKGQLPANKQHSPDQPDYAEQLIGAYLAFQQQHQYDEVVPWPAVPPGFGLCYGERDARAVKLATATQEYRGRFYCLALDVESVLARRKPPVYLTLAGAAAMILCDLGFSPEHGAGIYMIAGSAGILAHGVEQLPRNWNEYPFWAESSYSNYEGPDPVQTITEKT